MIWKRRNFVKTTTALAGVGSCGLISLVGCTPVKYITGEVINDAMSVDKTAWGEAEFVLVKHPQLSAPIFLKKRESDYVALLLECTHKQCEVRPNSRSLKCPCHGSEFDHMGEVINGPANENLKSFNTWDDEHTIYIQ